MISANRRAMANNAEEEGCRKYKRSGSMSDCIEKIDARIATGSPTSDAIFRNPLWAVGGSHPS